MGREDDSTNSKSGAPRDELVLEWGQKDEKTRAGNHPKNFALRFEPKWQRTMRN